MALDKASIWKAGGMTRCGRKGSKAASCFAADVKRMQSKDKDTQLRDFVYIIICIHYIYIYIDTYTSLDSRYL